MSQEAANHNQQENQPLTETENPACTTACTSEGKTSIETLAGELLRLSPEDRAKLAALLLAPNEGED